jgi:hypothetical protein
MHLRNAGADTTKRLERIGGQRACVVNNDGLLRDDPRHREIGRNGTKLTIPESENDDRRVDRCCRNTFARRPQRDRNLLLLERRTERTTNFARTENEHLHENRAPSYARFLEGMRRRPPLLLLVVLPLIAAPAIVATLTSSEGGGGAVVVVSVAPALACTGFTSIPAIPNNGDDGKAPLVALNSRVLLYEASSMLTKKPQPEDDLVLVEGAEVKGAAAESDAGPFPGIQVPLQRRELFPSLVELVPLAPLKPGTEYTLVWREKGYAVPRAQAHFNVSDRRDEKSPRIGVIGPATIESPPEARTSCDTSDRKMLVPFAFEDESPVVVGIWDGARIVPDSEPLGYASVYNKQLRITLRANTTPTMITLMAFDSAGHRSAPCSLSVDAQDALVKRGGCGCGKSGTPKREVKDCRVGGAAQSQATGK